MASPISSDAKSSAVLGSPHFTRDAIPDVSGVRATSLSFPVRGCEVVQHHLQISPFGYLCGLSLSWLDARVKQYF